jgi:anti-sigma B factor antagonist
MRDETLRVQAHPGRTHDELIIELTGPLLCQNLFDFQQSVRACGARVLIVDMTDVPYVDSAGVGALVGAYVSFQKDDHHLALVGVSDRVHSLFTMTQVERFFQMYPTVADAQAAISQQAANAARTA